MTVIAALALAAGLAAQPAVQAGLPPALEQEARHIEELVIAPCCWSQQVSVHQSPAADQMRAQIRAWLADGKSEDQILDAFVGQYGERILAVPRARGYKLTLFVLPVVLLVGTGLLLGLLVRRMARARTLAPAGLAGASAPLADSYDERLDDELRDLD
jgi:cytochrome c-type biogenesis protein CcmH